MPSPAPLPSAHPSPAPRPTTLLLGADGFLGRWLALDLLRGGHPVAAGLRGGGARDTALRTWLTAHGADTTALTTVDADVSRPGLGLSAADEDLLGEVRDVVNLAARYAFGLSRAEARAANLDGAVHPLRWASGRPALRRVVHLSGYRVGRSAGLRHPLPPSDADRLYRELGAYEASKTEGDIAVRTLAPELGVPLTVVNPGAVIGHSRTGEAGQYLGLATLVEQLWTGRLPALAGSRRTVVPVVAVDHLAAFLAAAPVHDTAAVQVHTVLDPATPPLPELVAIAARRLGVRAPRLLLPVGLVRRLPRALTGVEPETLSFLSEDVYDTESAELLAAAAGLAHPPVERLVGDWAARLVADRFPGAAPAGRPESASVAGQ
ncbi:SDR family oxidoreductase [Kitasatospora sp. NBC_01539]|uniref:SDR family oxidoreductase n=1 Tax=Kitasatospora sp. NBC_01539 TaxID=2903577 RepID=UPI0038602AB8